MPFSKSTVGDFVLWNSLPLYLNCTPTFSLHAACGDICASLIFSRHQFFVPPEVYGGSNLRSRADYLHHFMFRDALSIFRHKERQA